MCHFLRKLNLFPQSVLYLWRCINYQAFPQTAVPVSELHHLSYILVQLPVTSRIITIYVYMLYDFTRWARDNVHCHQPRLALASWPPPSKMQTLQVLPALVLSKALTGVSSLCPTASFHLVITSETSTITTNTLENWTTGSEIVKSLTDHMVFYSSFPHAAGL